LSYTPGYTNNAVDFMRRRSLETHGQWLEPLLAPGQRILDLGCGPGTITIGVARRIAPGEVIGIDPESSQVEAARSLAARENFPPKFEIGRAGELPFTDESFDGAYAHAVFEHLSNPHNALLDLRRKLRRGGFAALRSPDWGGFLVHPLSPDVQQALALYQEIQTANGGDIHAGRKLGGWLRDAGFKEVKASATYEVYMDAAEIAEYLALRIETIAAHLASALRNFGAGRDAFFAQAWGEAVGRRED